MHVVVGGLPLRGGDVAVQRLRVEQAARGRAAVQRRVRRRRHRRAPQRRRRAARRAHRYLQRYARTLRNTGKAGLIASIELPFLLAGWKPSNNLVYISNNMK